MTTDASKQHLIFIKQRDGVLTNCINTDGTKTAVKKDRHLLKVVSPEPNVQQCPSSWRNTEAVRTFNKENTTEAQNNPGRMRGGWDQTELGDFQSMEDRATAVSTVQKQSLLVWRSSFSANEPPKVYYLQRKVPSSH